MGKMGGGEWDYSYTMNESQDGRHNMGNTVMDTVTVTALCGAGGSWTLSCVALAVSVAVGRQSCQIAILQT